MEEGRAIGGVHLLTFVVTTQANKKCKNKKTKWRITATKGDNLKTFSGSWRSKSNSQEGWILATFSSSSSSSGCCCGSPKEKKRVEGLNGGVFIDININIYTYIRVIWLIIKYY